MKFRGHETFFIRKGWISKGIRAIQKDHFVFSSKENNPMDVLGIGSNMVRSLHYWMQATGVANDISYSKQKAMILTNFGKLISEHDRYLEEMGTLFLLHYKLATNEKLATSWYYMFNHFPVSEFDQDDFVKELSAYVTGKGEKLPSMRAMTDDFNCIIGTYVSRYEINPDKVSPENNIDCPFGELSLMTTVDRRKKVYRKAAPSSETIDPWVTLAVIMDNAEGRSDISLNELLNAPGNIGRIFNLDVITMLEVLQNAESTGILKIIRTAGLDIIRLYDHFEFTECVKKYYESIEDGRVSGGEREWMT